MPEDWISVKPAGLSCKPSPVYGGDGIATKNVLFGFMSNISVADWIFSSSATWWLARLAGSVISAVWNYAVSAAIVWRR